MSNNFIIEMEPDQDGVFRKKRIIKDQAVKRKKELPYQKSHYRRSLQEENIHIPVIDEVLEGFEIGAEILNKLRRLGVVR